MILPAILVWLAVGAAIVALSMILDPEAFDEAQRVTRCSQLEAALVLLFAVIFWPFVFWELVFDENDEDDEQ